jgi:hypothetical protein
MSEQLRKHADELSLQAGIFSRCNWGTLNDAGNVEVFPDLLDALVVRLEQAVAVMRSAAAALPAGPSQEEPCVCEVDDGLVQEWVMKVRDVARSKGFTVRKRNTKLSALPAGGGARQIPKDHEEKT